MPDFPCFLNWIIENVSDTSQSDTTCHVDNAGHGGGHAGHWGQTSLKRNGSFKAINYWL